MVASIALGQPATQPVTTLPSVETPRVELGPEWDGSAIGLFISPPAGLKVVPTSESESVRFVDTARDWQMTVQRIELIDPLPMRTAPEAVNKQRQAGLLDSAVEQALRDTNGKLLRKDVVYLPNHEAGLLVVQFSAGLKDRLQQRALIRSADRLYYVVSLTTPAPRENVESDPETKFAIDCFMASLESAAILDLTAVRENQDDRLLRTRNLLVNLTPEKVKSTLVSEQYFRVIRNGRDVGYSYVVEELGNDLPRRGVQRVDGNDGVVIGIRSRSITPAGQQVDSETWSWTAFKRSPDLGARRESWSYRAFTNVGRPDRDFYSEFGVATIQERPIAGEFKDVWWLDVSRNAKKVALDPIKRQLPPFYMPTTLNQLLPRLLDYKAANTYLVAAYDSEKRELVFRYIDVKPIAEIVLLGKSYLATTVEDRVGLRGVVTRHYLTAGGRYLGSETPSAKTIVVPSTADEIARVWADADLTRPGEVSE